MTSGNQYAWAALTMWGSSDIATGKRFMVVDLNRPAFISSSCLLVIQRVAQKLARRCGQIALCGGPRCVHDHPRHQARFAAAALLTESTQSLRSRRRTWWGWVNDILRPVIGR